VTDLYSKIYTLAQLNDFYSILTFLHEQERAGKIVLYAGTYSFETALERFGLYDDATFYIYAEDRSGYCVYINRMGCGIREDHKLFKLSHRYLYNKNHLSNCFFGEKDCRAGEYFGKGSTMNKKTVMPLAMKTKAFFCSYCGEKLVPHPKTRIVKCGDPDYKEHSHFGRGMRLLGDIELTEYDFKCLSCEKIVPYDEQCVIAEIQKHVGAHTLSQDSINENYEKANAALERKRKIGAIVSKLLGAAVLVLAIYYWFKSGNFPFKLYA